MAWQDLIGGIKAKGDKNTDIDRWYMLLSRHQVWVTPCSIALDLVKFVKEQYHNPRENNPQMIKQINAMSKEAQLMNYEMLEPRSVISDDYVDLERLMDNMLEMMRTLMRQRQWPKFKQKVTMIKEMSPIFYGKLVHKFKPTWIAYWRQSYRQ